MLRFTMTSYEDSEKERVTPSGGSVPHVLRWLADGTPVRVRQSLTPWMWAGLALIWFALAQGMARTIRDAYANVGITFTNTQLRTDLLAEWIAWLILLPAVFEAFDRTPLGRPHLLRNLFLRALAITVSAALHGLTIWADVQALGGALGVAPDVLRSPYLSLVQSMSDDV